MANAASLAVATEAGTATAVAPAHQKPASFPPRPHRADHAASGVVYPATSLRWLADSAGCGRQAHGDRIPVGRRCRPSQIRTFNAVTFCDPQTALPWPAGPTLR